MRKYVILVLFLLAAGLVYFLGKPKLLGNDREQIQESIAAFHEVQPEEIQLELVQDTEEQGENYRFAVYLRRDKKEDRDWEEAWDFPYLAVFQQRRNGDFVKMQYNGDRYWFSRSWEHFSVADSNVYYVYDVPGPEGRCQFVYVMNENVAVLRKEKTGEVYEITDHPFLIPFLPYDGIEGFIAEDGAGNRIA
nr:hypothetical protein [uncultured Anaerotignum sp.]